MAKFVWYIIMKQFIFLLLILGSLLPACQPLDVELRKQAKPNIVADEILWGKLGHMREVPSNNGVQPSIVNGEEAVPYSIPYQGALFIPVTNGLSFCGCSLINRRTVLTAAHCVNSRTDNVTVIFGAHYVLTNETTQQEFNSGDVIVHQNYSSPTLLHDIAIIHLLEQAVINEYVRAILLPLNADHDYLGNHTLVTGWGRPSDSTTDISPVLRQVSVPVISNTVCNMAYIGLVDPSRICTSGSYGKGTCNGDSGGPLTLNGVQIGVVSFVSTNGCEAGWPPGYARVTYYLDWIRQNSLPDE